MRKGFYMNIEKKYIFIAVLIILFAIITPFILLNNKKDSYAAKTRMKSIGVMVVLVILTIICILPIWILFVNSSRESQNITNEGLSLIPGNYFIENIKEMIRECAKMYGDRIAYSYRIKPHDEKAVTKTYIELKDDVTALATELIARGYQGKHIALIGKLSYSWVLVYYATLSIGSVLIPLDRDWQAADLADTVKKADTDLLIVDADIKIDLTASKVAYALKPHKVFLFDAETEERIYFEV
jgi:ABC-type glycerol-3-phosphate transport system permease component